MAKLALAGKGRRLKSHHASRLEIEMILVCKQLAKSQLWFVVAMLLFSPTKTAFCQSGVGGSPAQIPLTIGIGAFPCSDWLSGDNKRVLDGVNWIAGFWSRLNFSPPNKSVGNAVGSVEIFNSVRRFCLSHPSYTLSTATAQVYINFVMDNK